jgi:hypothetical protein
MHSRCIPSDGACLSLFFINRTQQQFKDNSLYRATLLNFFQAKFIRGLIPLLQTSLKVFSASVNFEN